MERGARTTGDMLTVQAGRWADVLGGWANGAWTAMQPMLSAMGTHITSWLNSTADTIERNAARWGQALVGGMSPKPDAMNGAMQSIVDGMDAWIQGDGVNAMIRLGNSLADALVAAIKAKLETDMTPAALWHVLTTSAPFQPTGGGLLGAIAPGIQNYTTAPFAPGGALSNQVPTAPGANAVPYGSRGITPGAADSWRQFGGGADTWQKWAPPPGVVAPTAFASIGREVAAMEGAAGRVAQAAAHAARQASNQGFQDALTAAARAGNPLTSAGSTQLLGGGGPTINITVSVGTGAVQVTQDATGGSATPQTRDYGLKVGEAIADALARFARAEQSVPLPPRHAVGGSRG
jgi:hypothetical protein